MKDNADILNRVLLITFVQVSPSCQCDSDTMDVVLNILLTGFCVSFGEFLYGFGGFGSADSKLNAMLHRYRVD